MLKMLENNQITQRFIECHDFLKKSGKIKSSRQFALALGCMPQNLNEILKGRREVTVELLQKAVSIYHINPSYILAGNVTMFSKNELEAFTLEPISANSLQEIKHQINEILEILDEQTSLIIKLHVKLQQLTEPPEDENMNDEL